MCEIKKVQMIHMSEHECFVLIQKVYKFDLLTQGLGQFDQRAMFW